MTRRPPTPLPAPTRPAAIGKPLGRRGRPRLPREPLSNWQIALRFALGEKVVSIAADYDITHGMVSKIAHAHGMPPRSAPRTGKPDAAAVARMREHARLLSEHHHRQAQRWACAAQAD